MQMGRKYQIERAEVLRYLGYSGQGVDESLLGRVDDIVARCQMVSNPGFVYRLFPVEERRDAICLAGTTLELKGASIAGHLHGARECAVMVATAGLGNERELRRLSLLNGLDGMVFDAAGSALAEAVADACNARIVADARERGLYAKWRFSPGYGDLPLSLQPAIVQVVAADKRLGVTVTDTNLLIPAKSVTAFVGLFDTPQDDKRTCADCDFAPHCELLKRGTPCYR